MTNRNMILFSAIVVVALATVSGWAGQQLPAGAQLPLHWNAFGEIDRYGDKWTALMLPPLLAAILTLVFWGITRIEPQQDNLNVSRNLLATVWIGTLGIAAVIELMVVAAAFHWPLAALPLIVGGVGLFTMALGNQLSKSRQMYLIGIRTPWTLADPDVWIATHRLGGKLMMLAGLVWLVCALAGWVGPVTLLWLVFAMMLASLVPVVYSYILWRRIGRKS